MERTEKGPGARERMWDDQWPSSAAGRHESDAALETDVDDELTPFPGMSGTDDAIIAAEEAQPYVPPVDPPVLPGGRDGVLVASGFGFSAENDSGESDPHGDEDIRDAARLLLQRDSLASQYRLRVQVAGGVVHLTGALPSLDDADHIASVLSNLAGVVEVVDDTTLDPQIG